MAAPVPASVSVHHSFWTVPLFVYGVLGAISTVAFLVVVMLWAARKNARIRDLRWPWWALAAFGMLLLAVGMSNWFQRGVFLSAAGIALVWMVVAFFLQRKDVSREPRRAADTAAEQPMTPAHEPRDPGRSYEATPRHEVSGQGIYRQITATLHNVGNGYDRGVTCIIRHPDGRTYGHEWSGLDTPAIRRMIAEQGHVVGAGKEGPYLITWRTVPPRGFEPEVIVEEEVVLEPTGPLSGWAAGHKEDGEEKEEFFVKGPPDKPLIGFQCMISRDSRPDTEWPFTADDHDLARLPQPKSERSFLFPGDFRDAPGIRDLHDGTYTVYWSAREPGEELGSRKALDVARDTFTITRENQIV